MAEHDQVFNSFEQWVNKASSWLTRHPDYRQGSFQAVCFDSKGRLCRNGRDFMRARDDGSFPVRWLWPDQIATVGRDVAAHRALVAADPLFVLLPHAARVSEADVTAALGGEA